MGNKVFLIGATLVAAVSLWCNNAKKNVAPTQNKPNIIFIMSDDHAASAIGVYKSRLAAINPTPNIDAFAKDGMVFTNAYCTNSICTPARANILTGQYSQTNGVLVLDDTLPANKQYLPIEMKKLGYTTTIIGKWHLGAEPAAFDYYKVLPGQGKYFDAIFSVCKKTLHSNIGNSFSKK
jgi:arylsulfatase A-like enzyme